MNHDIEKALDNLEKGAMLIINKHYLIYKIRQGKEGNIYGKRRTDTQRKRMVGYVDFMGK